MFRLNISSCVSYYGKLDTQTPVYAFIFIVSLAVWKLYPIQGKGSEADFTKSAIDMVYGFFDFSVEL